MLPCYHVAVLAFPLIGLIHLLALSAPDAGLEPGLGEHTPAFQAVLLARELLAGDLDALQTATPNGFTFEERQAWSQGAIHSEWFQALERRPLAGTQLYGVEVLSLDEMVKRYGKPPARLSTLNLSAARVAVVNLGGRALLVFFRKRGEAWVLSGISD